VKDRLKLGLRFDAAAMRRELDGLDASDWIDHFVPQNYDGTWSVLPFRAPAGARHPIQTIYSDPSCDTFVDTPLLARCPYFQQILGRFQCPLHAVRLMKLTPGSTIRPHADLDLAAELGRVRLHIPVTTNPDVEFRLNGEPIAMDEGECWYLRLSDTHSVANGGRTDRVHLVIDALVNPWLEEQLRHAEGAAIDHDPLAGWVPCAVRTDISPPVVQWCHVGTNAFTEPFFSETVRRALRKNTALQATPIETLIERCRSQPGVPPTAFIFHTSRCGSTLFSQMAAALPRTVVISEALAVDHVMRAPAPESQRVDWLRALLSALGQRRGSDADRLFVKFDAWHIVDLALVQRAFPAVPCVFLYRDPAAVVASQFRMPGLHMVPGLIDPSLIGLDLPAALQLRREEYIGRMLGAIYAAGVAWAREGRVALMNYAELPEGAAVRLLEWCGLKSDDSVRERLDRVTQFDAKTPSLPFDGGATRVPARDEPAIRAAAALIAPYYEDLETMRGF
jgi:Aspartyl/Asparaginyl beta-hydroxylase